ncbi:FAD-binding domain-containing protein [Choiromyces venosus 120613-1]|uniref:FAD-binding domain-containing protein n=1 Tax=Choiromyces venosus 120613-1 TaxID=1336337 RepID=A0A3N4JFG1_9PEZI|nr:FAD-binding domain-containing protein [Choiromyces venosus 120613-1]
MRFHAISLLGIGSALFNVAYTAAIGLDITGTPVLKARQTVTPTTTTSTATGSILPTITDFVGFLGLDPTTANDVAVKLNDSAVALNLISPAPTAKLRKRDLVLATNLACWIIQLKFAANSCVDGTTPYATLSTMNWSKTCWLKPQCILSPNTPDDVALTMRIISFLNVKYSVRSGGHTPNPGYANLDGGVLIELSKFRTVSLSADGTVASIGPGLTWVEVYDYLAQMGTTVLGGRIPHVGVGGLILGGGLSFFANQYGLVCDNVKNFQIVTPDSRILNANAVENSDLFWALKGGSGNFGIVTRFDMYTRNDLSSIWYEVRVYSTDQTPALLDAIENFQMNGEADKKAGFVFSATTGATLVGFVYGSPIASPPAFSAFYNIPFLANFAPSTIGTHYGLVASLTSAFSSVPARHDYRAASTGVNATMYKQVYAFWMSTALEINAATNGSANMSFSIQSFSKSAVDFGYAAGGNTFGLVSKTQQWFTMLIDWDNATDDVAVRAAGKAVTDKWSEVSNAMGFGNSFIYTDDASRDENPLAGYASSNIAQMKTISQKYDPKQVAQILQNDGYLLSKVP